MKGFKKVFGKKDKKKKKPAVSEKNRVFSKQYSSSSVASTTSTISTESTDSAKPPKRMIGAAYMGNGVGGFGATDPSQKSTYQPPVADEYIPSDPSSRKKKKGKKIANDTDSESEPEFDSDVESQKPKSKRKQIVDNLLRDAKDGDDSADGLFLFLVRNHTLTAPCLGRHVDSLDPLRKCLVLLFTSLATLLTSLWMIVYESLDVAAQVSFGLIAVPALTLILKIIIRFGRNARTSGILVIATVAFIDLIVLIWVGWETWSLIVHHSTELWTALILWAEAFALNLVIEIPGLIIWFLGCKCCCGGCFRGCFKNFSLT